MKKLSSEKGMFLIICLLLLIVLAIIGLSTSSVSVTNNKANAYSSSIAEAQQKAESIANFVFSILDSQNKILQDITPSIPSTSCSPITNCLIWNSQPNITGGGSMTDTKSNTTIKQWWYANTWAYPNATQLHAFAAGKTYSSINGSQPNDPIANYVVIQDGPTVTDPQGYNIRNLRIIAYATDKNGQTAAVKQIYYPWVARCKTDPGSPTPGPGCLERAVCTWIRNNRDWCLTNASLCNDPYYSGRGYRIAAVPLTPTQGGDCYELRCCMPSQVIWVNGGSTTCRF